MEGVGWGADMTNHPLLGAFSHSSLSYLCQARVDVNITCSGAAIASASCQSVRLSNALHEDF